MSSDTADLARRTGEALQRRDRVGFVDAVRSLIEARAPLRTGWEKLATPLLDFGELGLARRAADLHSQVNERSPEALVAQAVIYARAGLREEALALLEAVPRNVPDAATNAYLRGTLLMNLGDAPAARSALTDAHRARPTSGQILHALAAVVSLHEDPEAAALIEAAEAAMASAPDAERAPYLYALGKLYEDRGEVDRAFAAFSEAGDVQARVRPYNAEADRKSAGAAVSGWSNARIHEIAEAVAPISARPILVTGPPRSGSTLVEQILVSHSEVSDGEELGRFGLVAASVGGVSGGNLSAAQADEAAAYYGHLFEQRFGSGACAVDKSLDASRYLGLAASVLPQAPLIWLKRDAADTAWSVFRNYFARGVAWSSRLEDIAGHLSLEDALLDRWQEILGRRLLVVRYEELVANPADIIPPMLAHCGLAPEPGVFTPEKTKRAVTTNSTMQVRRPISPRSVGSAEAYRHHLQPFYDAYEAARVTLVDD